MNIPDSSLPIGGREEDSALHVGYIASQDAFLMLDLDCKGLVGVHLHAIQTAVSGALSIPALHIEDCSHAYVRVC